MLTSGDWDIEGVLDCASPLICELIGKKYDTRKRRCKFSLGIVRGHSRLRRSSAKRLTTY